MAGDPNRDESGNAFNASVNSAAAPPTFAATVTPANGSAAPASGVNNGNAKLVDDILASDRGISTLLTRLKQSIASAREFAAFLKKRSSLEEEQASGLRRLSKAQLEAVKRSDVRAGSYAAQLFDVMRTHERMADNGMQFALSLHQMHEDLTELSNNIERGRKHWKHEGLDSEKKASDAEAAMQKAKARYDSLAEEYDRARTGDTKGSRRLGLKGPKSAEQHETDLMRKVQLADTDYEEKVKLAQAQREQLLRDGRPQAVKALRELCVECDAGLTLQLQKYAAFNEKLLLGNGLAVSPLTDRDARGGERSMRDVVLDIDNDRDFHSFVSSFQLPPKPSEIKYEKHPSLGPKTQQPNPPPGGYPQQQQPPPQQSPNLTLNTGGNSSQFGSVNANNQFANQPPASVFASSQTPVYGSPPSGYPSPAAPQSAFAPTTQTPTQYGTPQSAQVRQNYSPLPYPTHPNEQVAPQSQQTGAYGLAPNTPNLTTGVQSFSSRPTSAGNGASPAAASLRPVFGVPLDDLFERDQSAVPMVVVQCILAIDTFGLDVEGIYRLSGTASHVQQLRDQFNQNAAGVDLRNPAAFYHDINSVGSLLKQFFRDLPDPLFTRMSYDAFIQAAKKDDETARRDALHQAINDLPDANYATLRAIVLHLSRVMQHESRNRMGSSNLALCFAPSLMGSHNGASIAEASLQARVLDTILLNATAIFDED